MKKDLNEDTKEILLTELRAAREKHKLLLDLAREAGEEYYNIFFQIYPSEIME